MRGLIGRLALVGALIASICGITIAQAMTPSSATLDMHESYALLTSTYYSKVNPQLLLDGARDALNVDLRKHHRSTRVPVLRATNNADANVALLDEAVARVQRQTHETPTAVIYGAIAGMAKSLGDRYTVFFTPEELRMFDSALDPAKISGIGVLIQPDDVTKYIRAFYVVPGTPAEGAGIVSGDTFLAVDGVSTKGLKTEDASKLLRGKAGSVVHVTVQHDQNPPRIVSITRAAVEPPTVIYKMLPQNIGYIYILAFGRETTDQFNVALDRLQRGGARAYVLDLRDDGGGYVNTAIDISSRFINDDPIVSVQERGSHITTVTADNTAIAPKPMTILVNRYTASASEITAGALQDDGIGVLVGEKTFGKGVVQTLTPLPDGAGIKITTAHYYTPKNRDINLKGIVPDVPVVENRDARFGEVGHDLQLQVALALLEKKLAVLKP